jgi:hypothetical protein
MWVWALSSGRCSISTMMEQPLAYDCGNTSPVRSDASSFAELDGSGGGETLNKHGCVPSHSAISRMSCRVNCRGISFLRSKGESPGPD